MGITERIDAITAIPPEYRAEVLPAPKSVKVELTTACNYACAFCVRSTRANVAREIDDVLYTRLLREMRTAGVEELGLFYIGESMLTPRLPSAIREAKEAGFPYVFVTTNGSAAWPSRVEACMAAGLDSLKFSVNFADDEQFRDIARVKTPLYHRALENIAAARRVRDEGGYGCRLYASSIQFDGEQGARMQRVIDEHVRPYVDECYQLPLFSMGGAGTNVGKPQAGNPGRVGAMRDPLPCWSVTTGHITADGYLSACCFGIGIDGDLIMADLNEVDFMTGWNSEAFQQLRRAHLARDVTGTPCEQCCAGS